MEVRWCAMADISLRERVMHEGKYFIIRKGIGFVISFGGMLLLMRLIGVENYGLYITIMGIIAFINEICRMGIHYYLIREETQADRKQYHLAFTFILLTSFVAVIFGIAMSYLLRGWLNNDDIQLPFIVALIGILYGAYLVPAMAILERGLEYRKVAFYELYTQLVYYSASLALVFLNFGIWAPIVGNLIQGGFAVICCYVLSRYRPTIYWSWSKLKEILKYGSGNTLSQQIWELRNLVNPLLIAKFVGLEGVACVSLSIRVVEALSFVNRSIERISFSLLAKVQSDKRRVENIINEAMLMQVFSFTPLLIGFGVFAQWMIPFFFGEELLPVLYIFPFIAMGYLVSSIFSLHINILYVRAAIWEVSRFNIIHVLIFIATVYFLLPPYQLYGYAIAEIGSLVSYYAIHLSVRKRYHIHYRIPFICMFTCIPIVFLPMIAFPWALILLVPTLVMITITYYKMGLFSYIQKIFNLKLASDQQL
jgi:O-antigen/teichoic acid export membrane protein